MKIPIFYPQFAALDVWAVFGKFFCCVIEEEELQLHFG
jgi:hypothetical protein